MNRPIAVIILAAGKGTRMGETGVHKVCLEVRGVPVILRALETYKVCGSALNIIVVGAMAESVMATVNRRFPETSYAFQEKPLGTGDAARKGADMLRKMGFEGDVLVVAGDKVIDPKVIRRLLEIHHQTAADVTLATAERPPGSSAGILLKSSSGGIAGILEESERRRIVAIAALNELFHERDAIGPAAVFETIRNAGGEKVARDLAAEIWGKDERELTRRDYEKLFSADERLGIVQAGGQRFLATRVCEHWDQMNMATYLFRAPVLHESLGRLKSNRANQEEYLTDVFEILARGASPAKIIGCEISDPEDLMAFNTPEELSAIEEVYRRRLEKAAG